MSLVLASVAVGAWFLAGFSNAQTLEDFSASCADVPNALQSIGAFENVTVNLATFIPAGTNLTLPTDANLSTCFRPSIQTPKQLVATDLCRVSMNVATSNSSEITLEAWLPLNWTGRFLGTGNGGVDGCIQYEDMAYASSMGFATVGANNGHNGTSGLAFYKSPEVIEDYAWRSIYTSVQVGKALTNNFYQRQYTKSYYLGCSTGGRQGFKMAQDYPDIFDGIVAGAPAVAFNNLTSWSGHFYVITGNNSSPSYIPAATWQGPIHDMILNQCDALDGVADGILEDPSLCHPIAEVLLCGVNQTSTIDNCLSSTQVDTVNEIFRAYREPNESMIYPRIQPGSELLEPYFYYTGNSFSYTNDWYRYAVLNDPDWDPSTLTVEDAAYANDLNPADVDSWNGNLSAFQAHGGKILHYHGQEDQIISSLNSNRYYDHVSDTMAMPPSELDSFYRFFRVSGMYHCRSGEGAHNIGNLAANLGPTMDSQNNVLLRIVDWVENGAAPETITGTRYVNDTVGLGVELVRDHCRYPLRNVCVDPGNYMEAGAWKCVV